MKKMIWILILVAFVLSMIPTVNAYASPLGEVKVIDGKNVAGTFSFEVSDYSGRVETRTIDWSESYLSWLAFWGYNYVETTSMKGLSVQAWDGFKWTDEDMNHRRYLVKK